MSGMSGLFLSNIEVKGFRAFRHLTIEKFGHVNLIVGMNSVGKTCLLEALSLYVRQGSPLAFRQLLLSREETQRVPFSARAQSEFNIEDTAGDFRHLFYGRQDIANSPEPMRIGPIGDTFNTLQASIRWRPLEERSIQRQGRLPLYEEKGVPQEDTDALLEPVLSVEFAHEVVEAPLQQLVRIDSMGLARRSQRNGAVHAFQSVPMSGLNSSDVARLWSNVTLTPQEDDVLNALRIILPHVDGVRVVSREEGSRNPTVIVKVADFAAPVPLKSMGEGVNRLFALILALANCRGGVLLADEIESGLHYSVQKPMWDLVFQVAQRLDVQVFATSHSHDCVRAFCKSALEHPEEGVITRLFRSKGGDVRSTLYDEEDMRVVAEQDIEVR